MCIVVYASPCCELHSLCLVTLSLDPDTGIGVWQQALLQGSIVDEAVKLLQLEYAQIDGE